MARYAGKNLVLNFIHAGGTTVFSSDFRSLDVAAGSGQADKAAGNDTHRAYIPTLQDTTADMNLLDPGGATGSAFWVATVPTTAGTFIWGPIGTTATNPKFTVTDAHIVKRDVSYPYDDVVEWDISIQFNTIPVQTAY